MSEGRKSGVLRRLLAGLPVLLLVLTACDQPPGPTAPPEAVRTRTATAGAAVAGPEGAAATVPAIDTPSPSPTAAPTDTPEPTNTPRPTSTPRPSPTPAGFYGDRAGGWSIQFPTGWEVTETGEDFPALTAADPGSEITMMVGWTFVPAEDSLEDAIDAFTELLTAPWEEVEEAVSDEVVLKDGTVARRTTVTAGGRPARQIELVMAARGARLYVVVVAATTGTFEARARTIESIVGSLTLTPVQLYDVDRSTALVRVGEEPYDLDPATTEDGPADYVGHLFRGLVMLDTNLQVVPDLAERWEISDDGRTYTFFLHPDAVFFDGKPVTAADFKYAWERAADPAVGSTKTRTYLGDIVGVEEKLDGEADAISGVTVVDEQTLQVTIDEPKVYFLAKLTWPSGFVVDRENVESGGDDWWREPNGVGPFRIERWDDDVIVFVRNEGYYGPLPRLERVVYLLDAGPSVQLYESGEVDMAGVGASMVERVEDPNDPLHADLHTTANMCTSRIVLDASRPPFDDPLVRQAFSYAVDRDELIEIVFKGALPAAEGPLPPGMPGYSDELEGYRFDPERALELIAQSSYGDPASLPPLTFTAEGYTGASTSVESLVETWNEVFGIEIQIELLEPFGFVNRIKEEHGHLFMLGWCADYPDPENFVDVLYHSESEENLGRYRNPEVDALLEQARTERDVEARIALYQEAEQAIVDDAVSIWLTHSVSRLLIKPYVHGYEVLPMSVPQLQNVYLDPH
ncbi:MAG TPA: ABC transporter substrate-binding protein [Anaerolineae bacterium]|nr:ABC transporter substrate-binding protein [Anaerolineae bacterium]